MELQEFVAKTLSQIIGAIDTTRGGKPERLPLHYEAKTDAQFAGFTKEYQARVVHSVEFDIAVTVSSADKLEGEAGIKVVGIGGSGKASTEAEKSSVSRIKFSVPVVL